MPTQGDLGIRPAYKDWEYGCIGMDRAAEDIITSYFSGYPETGRKRTFFCYMDERAVYKEGGFPYFRFYYHQAIGFSLVYEYTVYYLANETSAVGRFLHG